MIINQNLPPSSDIWSLLARAKRLGYGISSMSALRTLLLFARHAPMATSPVLPHFHQHGIYA
tara:strand:- start:2041 stop:2226 length:186 start_codon:yes stop_codon:yes gene_type:complete